MKQSIPVSSISIVHGITQGETNRLSVSAILAGEGAPVTPVVRHYRDHYALVFGVNHLYAALERKSQSIEVEIEEVAHEN